jgi:hypothetical protein
MNDALVLARAMLRTVCTSGYSFGRAVRDGRVRFQSASGMP